MRRHFPNHFQHVDVSQGQVQCPYVQSNYDDDYINCCRIEGHDGPHVDGWDYELDKAFVQPNDLLDDLAEEAQELLAQLDGGNASADDLPALLGFIKRVSEL